MKYLIFEKKIVDKAETEFPVSSEMQWVDGNDSFSRGDIFEDGVLKIKPIVPKTADDIRRERNKLLSDSDWRLLREYEPKSELDAEWKTYRQSLRDLPNDPSFPNVNFPVKPQ